MTSKLVSTCIAVLLVVLAVPSSAQQARSGGGGNAQLIQQLQQLASERTSLQAENARMKKELADLAAERDSLQAAGPKLLERARAAETALQRSTTEAGSTESELNTMNSRMQELVTKFRETAQTLQDVETERTSFKQSLGERAQELQVCTDKNTALYALNAEILTKLESQGFWSKVSQAEPFTRLKRTQLENLVDDYKYRANEQQMPVTAAGSTP
jgi:chromosome segregation ATPase